LSNNKKAQKQHRPPYPDLIGQIDQWYPKHPDKMKEPVLVVIWHEIVEK